LAFARCSGFAPETRIYRAGLLDHHLFAMLVDVRGATHWRMIGYNVERPHHSPGELTPLEARQNHTGISAFNLPP